MGAVVALLRWRLRLAERAVTRPYDARASARLDRLLIALEALA